MRTLLLFVLLSISYSSFSQIFDKSISIGVSALYTHRQLRNSDGEKATQDTIEAKNSFEEPIFSYGAYIGYNHKLTKRLVLEGKLKYQRVGYTTRFVYNARSLIDPAIPVDYIHIFHIGSLNILGRYSFVSKKKFKLFLKTGLGLDYMIDNYIEEKENSSKTTIEPFNSLTTKPVNISFITGLGSSFKISNRSAINFGFEHTINLADFNTDPIRLRLAYFGMNLGYTYSLSLPEIITPKF